MSAVNDEHAVELQHFAGIRKVSKFDVNVRCYWVMAPRPHYRICMQFRGETGVIDVPHDREAELEVSIQEAIVCFTTSVLNRQEFPS